MNCALRDARHPILLSTEPKDVNLHHTEKSKCENNKENTKGRKVSLHIVTISISQDVSPIGFQEKNNQAHTSETEIQSSNPDTCCRI